MAEPNDPADPADRADPDQPEEESLPTHKDDLVALAIDRGRPSYEAWAMTVPDLKKWLEASGA